MSSQNPAIDPRRTALLIMDYQPAVLGRLNDHDRLLTLASGAIDLTRQAGITAAYVRVAFADEDYEEVPEANKMLAGVARSRALHHEAPETQIHGRLEPQSRSFLLVQCLAALPCGGSTRTPPALRRLHGSYEEAGQHGQLNQSVHAFRGTPTLEALRQK